MPDDFFNFECFCTFTWKIKNRYKSRLCIYSSSLMGGDIINLRFCERDAKIDTSDAVSFMRSVVTAVIFAPFYLINDVSLKIVFLRKEIISRVLLMSSIISLVFVVESLFVCVLTHSFSLFAGRLPLIVSLLSGVLLLMMHLAVNTFNLMLYEELKYMFPEDVDGASRSAKMMRNDAERNAWDERDAEKGAENSVAANVDKFELQKLTEDIILDAPVIKNNSDNELMKQLEVMSSHGLDDDTSKKVGFQASDIFSGNVVKLAGKKMPEAKYTMAATKYKNSKTGAFSDSELEKLAQEMIACTNPSRYIDERIIQEDGAGVDDVDVGFVDGLDISVIPGSFTMIV